MRAIANLSALAGDTLFAAACVLLALAVTPRADADVKETAPADATSVEQEPPGPMYAAPTRMDHAGRILAAVEINGQGPFRFIVDTGANRSAIAPRTVARLGLITQPDSAVDVQGVTGSAMLPSVDLDSLKVGQILMPHSRLPVLPGAVFAEADGILGVQGLESARIEVDFVNDRVTIAPSNGRRAPAAESLVVPVRLEHGGLLMTDGQMGRVPVHVVVDTGAERTLGNAPLRDALLKGIRSDRRTENNVLGATPAIAAGITFVAPAIKFGPVRLANLPVTFSDLNVFSVWGLADEPTVIIGMDLIGTLRKFTVDYPRKELQMTTFQFTAPNVQKCGPNECGSRIRPPEG